MGTDEVVDEGFRFQPPRMEWIGMDDFERKTTAKVATMIVDFGFGWLLKV